MCISIRGMHLENTAPAHLIYSDYVERGLRGELAKSLWGAIPVNMGDAYELITKIRSGYGVSSELEGFKKALKSEMRLMGLLTGRVEDSIDRLDRGVVEAGQQPMCLGGPSLILNKVGYSHSLCSLGDHGFVPVFYNADYDGVQAELLNIRLPSPSSRGLLLSYPSEPGEEGVPIHLLHNPSEDWLRKTLEKMEGNFKGIMKGVDQRTQDRVTQRLSHALTIIRGAYYCTENVSDWAAKILGSLLNLEADMGVPIISPSKPGLRRFYQGGYEYLLSEPVRSRFVDASNRAAEMVEGAGYRSQIGLRSRDYVPFFLECMKPGCRRSRVELKYGAGSVKGKCPKCGEMYEFSFNPGSPDLTEIIDWVSPRVDSRQIIVDSVMPVLAHVGGPGETSYYAEVIPAAGELGVPFPQYLRYTRVFYNTPWNEAAAREVDALGSPTILDEALFTALGEWVEARNSDDGGALAEAHRAIRVSIDGSFGALVAETGRMQVEIDGVKGQLSTVEDRGPLIKKMRETQARLGVLEQYLSWAYGRFSPERLGQEVSWHWLDLATVTGLGDLMGVYARLYGRWTPNSSVYFANTG
jgi:hypothetical protein